MIGLKFLQNDQSTLTQTTSQTYIPNFGRTDLVALMVLMPDDQKAKEFIENKVINDNTNRNKMKKDIITKAEETKRIVELTNLVRSTIGITGIKQS